MVNDPVNPNHIGDDSVASTRMTTQSPTSLAPKTAQRTSLGHRLQRALTGRPNRRFPGLHSPPGGTASPSLLLSRRSAFPILGLLAVLAAGLMFLLPGGPLQAQDTSIEYAENGMDSVATFTGVDPEGRTVYWDLVSATGFQAIDTNGDGDTDDAGDIVAADVADAGDFTISADGVLTFKSPPSFESPNGGQVEPEEDTPASGSNTYNVVVVSSDDAPGATTDGEVPGNDNLPKMSYHKVTVEVTDVDEDGSVSLSTLQPQASVALNVAGTPTDDTDDKAAALKDQDASEAQINASKWKWEQSSAMDGPWTLISAETSPSYAPAADVAGMYVRLTATYNDKHDDDKTAMATSAHPVRKAPAGGNSAPEFSVGATDTRRVKENSPSGTAVGKPVTAGDAGDILTYTLAGDDASSFSIDRASGQIMTKASLNLEAGLTDRDGGTDGIQLQVTVRATDPYGDPDVETAVDTNSDTITVDITVENVNESPKMTVGPTRDSQDENEDADDDTGGMQIPILTYTATDVDATDTIQWSLSGDDRDALKIAPADATDTDATNGVSATLAFKKSPNYEKPTDADKDNVYMVTVVATDKKKLTATRDVVITVANDDDPGKITFSSEQPKVRIDFTANLTDEDGGEKDVKWAWRSAAGSGNPLACPADTTDFSVDEAVIAGAKSATYTPVTSPDSDVGQCLQATATYTDSNGSGKTMSAISANPVVDNLDNAIPEFREGGDKPVIQAARYIQESAEGGANVVVNPDGTTASTDTPSLDLVRATDPNGVVDVLTYTHGGRDKDSFAIASGTGQITVKTGAKLDYEKKNSYMVTVTATDPSLASATIDVTINVVNVNEGPVIAGEDDIAKEHPENSTGTIQRFQATDPERRPVYWSLKDDDSDYPDDDFFTISKNGVLSFMEGRDFENPLGGGDSNTYKVVVIASDDAPDVGTRIMTSERKFTVRVTNVRESGSVTVDRRVPQMNVAVTATLTDGDATSTETGAATWQWYRGSTAIETATAPSFTPTNAGSHKVEATYTAKGDTRTASRTISVRAAPDSNTAPNFENAGEARSVDENRANENVGNRVTANDAGDTLTYSVNPNTDFSIDNNGQLKTKVALDHEDPPTLSLTVTATDPSNESATVTVTVTINDVNEAPTIATGPTRAPDWPENKAIADAVATYGAGTDPEGDDLVWSLTGADATDFYIGNQTDGTPGTLTFKERPDYEKPAAANNVYRVTVEVSDGKLKATRPMTVTVTDVEEEGEVKLSTVAPRVAVELTASLEDSDDGVADVTWQWWKSAADGANQAPDFLDSDGDPSTANWTEIDDAESDTYEPVKDDLGRWLIARASYTDRRGEGKTARGESENAVRVNNDNRAPMFNENDQEITETTRKVKENTPVNEAEDNSDTSVIDESMQGNIGGPVAATDPNRDILTYTLGGPDMASFGIGRGSGQLMTKAELNREAKDTYMVTVTATDPQGLSDSVDVAIKVTDVDEAPEITVGGLVITGKGAIDYEEDGTSMAATYMALGPDAASATWSLSGADMGDFSISSAGVLTFKSSPDYETKNTYMVTVNANDGSNDAMKAVTVTITNMEEDGTVRLSTQQPRVGTAITATLTDADGDVTGTAWQWAKATTMDGTYSNIAGATSDSYTPVEGDANMHLRATASYTDGEGSGKTAIAVSENAVTAAAGDDLVDRYDADDSGEIDKTEVLKAINDYLFGEGDEAITKPDVLKLINLYLFS